MTAATAPGAVRGRAREGGSYRQRQASGCYRKPAPTINSRVP